MGCLKKTVFTLNIGNYAPDICDITYPLLKHYAKKIGAEFKVIDERKFPDFPVVYEKLQIRELGKENDWNIYLDSDALVHPETPDWTNFISKDTVLHNGTDFANIRWRYDEYFRRDGRNVGSCNWNTTASDWCLDLWTPLDIPLKEAIENIYPSVNEINTVVTTEHLIDDYTLSRNIARYGLKVKTICDLQKQLLPDSNFYWHIYTDTIEEKVRQMKEMVSDKKWNLKRYL